MVIILNNKHCVAWFAMKNTSSLLLKSVLIGSVIIGVTSCSSLSKPIEPLTEAQACLQINNLISDHANKFKEHKKSQKRRNRLMTSWAAQKVFPAAEECEIWEWSTGLYHYICNWKTKTEQETQQDYQAAMMIVQSCLNNQWQSESTTTKSGGKRTTFEKAGSKTQISLRYFKEPRSLIENWHTTVSIGDKNNLKAKVQ